jgi:hypothetical protein
MATTYPLEPRKQWDSPYQHTKRGGIMLPTMSLRYIIKSVPAPEFGPNIERNERVLQQFWRNEMTQEQMIAVSKGQTPEISGEWYDIPLAQL